MSRMTDERLESLLDNYYKAEPESIPVFDSSTAPSRRFFGGRRAIAAAASLFLACLIGAAAFFVFSKPTVRTAVAPESGGQTEYEALPGGVQKTVPTVPPSTEKGTQPTDNKTADVSGYPTDAPAGGLTFTAPYQSAPGADDAANSGRSETAATLAATERTVQTETSAAAPTAAATSGPSTEPPIVPTDNGELVQTMEYADWEDYVSHQSLYGIIDAGMLTGSGKVYFRIFAFDGSPIGDEELFCDSNLAYLDPYQYNTLKASYYLGGLEEEISKIRKGDCLTYCFYNEDGEVICTRIKIF